MINYMKGMHAKFGECPPLDIHKQARNNNVIIKESEDERPPWFSCERIVLAESGGAILDMNNAIALMSLVVGTHTNTSLPKPSSSIVSLK